MVKIIFGRYNNCSSNKSRPPNIPGFSTIVRFFAVEKLSIKEIENKIPAMPNIIRKICIGNLIEFSTLRSVVAVRSRMNKIPNPLNRSVETCELLEIKVRSK